MPVEEHKRGFARILKKEQGEKGRSDSGRLDSPGEKVEIPTIETEKRVAADDMAIFKVVVVSFHIHQVDVCCSIEAKERSTSYSFLGWSNSLPFTTTTATTRC